MTAEFALKATLGRDTAHTIASAGLDTPLHGVLPFVENYLTDKGIDSSAHTPTKLTGALLDQATLAVAMSTDHQARIAQDFQRQLPLFSEVAYATTEPLRDVDEMVPDWRRNQAQAVAYGCSVMDYIFDGMPRFVSRMPAFIGAD